MRLRQRLKYLLDEGFFVVSMESAPLTGEDQHVHLIYRWRAFPGGPFRTCSEYGVCGESEFAACRRLIESEHTR